mmetsp:Transcript_35330/g.74545  ORF Transcript_35330/g.74545 Transcript_35330/m.74545 type:complete len:83 (+) Transcript_35330:1-249(+)
MAECAPCLTGSPVEYARWLRDEWNVRTIRDLADVLEDEIGSLVAGNGRVGMWRKRQFCDAVVAAAAAAAAEEDRWGRGCCND